MTGSEEEFIQHVDQHLFSLPQKALPIIGRTGQLAYCAIDQGINNNY